jgi:hypothetical protein
MQALPCSSRFSLRDLGEIHIARPQSSDEQREADYDRGKAAGLGGYRLRGIESTSFLAGHARGCLDARGE